MRHFSFLFQIRSFIFLFCILSLGCASTPEPKKTKVTDLKIKKPLHPVVSIETSGDLYFAEGGDNVQLDFYGSCAPGYQTIMVQVETKTMVTKCDGGRYRYSFNLPKNVFKGPLKKGRFVLKKIKAYHSGHENLNATSYMLIDVKTKEIKSILNRQVRYEKIPTGQYEPVTEFSAFGSCTQGHQVKVDITAPDRFGKPISRFDDNKVCQASGFYFLSQIDGLVFKGLKFHITETAGKTPNLGDNRSPAAKSDQPKPVFNWTIPVD